MACSGAPYRPDRVGPAVDPAAWQNAAVEVPRDFDQRTLRGEASWYGERFQGRTTASGEPFDMYQFTAAHRALPFHTIVRATRLDTRQNVVVRITDRGPYAHDRIIDLSWAAAQDLGIVEAGHAEVQLEVLRWGGE